MMIREKVKRIIFLLPLFTLVGSCVFGPVNEREGRYGISYSLEDSKIRKVFKETIGGKQIVPLSNGDTLIINCSWIEHKWTFKRDYNESLIERGEQLVIEFEQTPTMDTYIRDWLIVSQSTLKSLGKVGDYSCYLRYPEDTPVLDRDFVVLEGQAIVHDTTEIGPRKLAEFKLE